MIDPAFSYEEGGSCSCGTLPKRRDFGKVPGAAHYLSALGGVHRLKARGRGRMPTCTTPRNVTMLEIVETLEGKLVIVDCLRDESLCTRASGCAAWEVWQKL